MLFHFKDLIEPKTPKTVTFHNKSIELLPYEMKYHRLIFQFHHLFLKMCKKYIVCCYTQNSYHFFLFISKKSLSLSLSQQASVSEGA